jgi:phage terminase Nu1 subunit (DNA packaging protein)
MANNTQCEVVPVGTLAKRLGITEKRIQQLVTLGVVIRGARGRYDLWGSVRGYVSYLQDRAAGRSGGDPAEGGNYEAHRARLYAARADMAEEQARLLKGKSHDAETVAEVMNQMLATFRSRLLALPTQAAPLVANSESPNECKAILTDAIYEALSELAAYPAQEIHARQLRREMPAPVPDNIEDDPAA